MSARTLAIGDIHGSLTALKQVIERAHVTTQDTLIFLGDYVDGWSETASLIDFLIELDQKQTCHFMIGNHDLWHIDWLEKDSRPPVWLANGGTQTIESYKDYSDEAKQKHLGFLKSMNGFYISNDHTLFLHAGFTSIHGPEHETYPSNFSWDRTLWEMALCMNEGLDRDSILFPKRLKLFKEIFIGHSATTNYNCIQPMNRYNLWNIDTGAGFTGKLTLMDTETKAYWQSDTVMDLHIHEHGRNYKKMSV